MAGSTKIAHWADGPLNLITTPKYQKAKSTAANEKSDPYVEAASAMAVVHNIVLRGLNSIYLQAANVAPADYEVFIGYCLAWYEVIDTHHKGEEAFLFPEIERITGDKGLMNANVAQHDAFHDGVEAFHTYLTSLAGKKHSFSGAELVRIIDTFSNALAHHLSDEITSMLELSRFGDRLPIVALGRDLGKRQSRGMYKTKGVVFFFLNQDRTYEDGLWKHWPPIPPVVRWILIRVLGSWHPGWWKFASCDYGGKPQKLCAGAGS